VFTRLIDKNTTIPTKKSQVFSTAEDGQTAVTIRVFQGEREMAKDNKFLGQFDLVGIPPSPRGMPQIEVTFDIDANGIVTVSAKDKATNKEQNIRIQASGGLTEAEIQQMMRDAQEHAGEDKKRRELVETRNRAEATVHDMEKTLKEHGEKVGASERSGIEAAMTEVREALKGEDAELIKSKTEALLQSSLKLGEAMYKGMNPDAAGGPEAAGGGSTGGSSSSADDGVVDADYEEVDEEKKKGGAR
jgi:molecular chaperone DnaK